MLAQVLADIRVPRVGRGPPRTRPDAVVADQAYSSGVNRTALRRRGIKAVIPQKNDEHRRPPTPRLRRRQTTRFRRRDLQGSQRRRALLQPRQAVARPGHPLRQTRHHLPRRGHPVRDPHPPINSRLSCTPRSLRTIARTARGCSPGSTGARSPSSMVSVSRLGPSGVAQGRTRGCENLRQEAIRGGRSTPRWPPAVSTPWARPCSGSEPRP